MPRTLLKRLIIVSIEEVETVISGETYIRYNSELRCFIRINQTKNMPRTLLKRLIIVSIEEVETVISGETYTRYNSELQCFIRINQTKKICQELC